MSTAVSLLIYLPLKASTSSPVIYNCWESTARESHSEESTPSWHVKKKKWGQFHGGSYLWKEAYNIILLIEPSEKKNPLSELTCTKYSSNNHPKNLDTESSNQNPKIFNQDNMALHVITNLLYISVNLHVLQ